MNAPPPRSGWFLIRRWEIVASILLVSLGWAYWTSPSQESVYTARLEVDWSPLGPAGVELLGPDGGEVVLSDTAAMASFLASPEFLKFTAEQLIREQFARVSVVGEEALWPGIDRGVDEVMGRLSRFSIQPSTDTSQLVIDFVGTQSGEVQSLAGAIGRELLALRNAAIHRELEEVRVFLKERTDSWLEREQFSIHALWRLRGKVQVASSGKVASRPGGDPHETPLAEVRPESSVSLYSGQESRLAPTGDPPAEPVLADCLKPLQEARGLEAELETLELDLIKMESEVQTSNRDAAAIREWMAGFNAIEEKLLDLRGRRRAFEAAVTPFLSGETRVADSASLKVQTLLFEPRTVSGINTPLKHYGIWGLYGLVFGLLFARWVDGLGSASQGPARHDAGQNISEMTEEGR